MIFVQVLGTPTEDTWPGITLSEELANYNFPAYLPEPLVKRAPRLDSDGVDLLSKFLPYEAKRRIAARAAMKHPYFDSLGPGVQTLADSKEKFVTCPFTSVLLPSSIPLFGARRALDSRPWLPLLRLLAVVGRRRKVEEAEHALVDEHIRAHKHISL